ncbi:MAG: GSCFA domain-containing protein [Bacteroidia bacterium]|jgi:hypothetical protein
MKFKLDFDITPPPKLLHIKSPVALWGSCFAEHMALKLKRHKFNLVQNPNGIQYNPISIFQSISDCMSQAEISNNSLFEYNGLWHSWEHHGRFKATSRNTLIENIRTERLLMHGQLKHSEFLIITFGNAWVYEHPEYKGVVANCHKIPATAFKKRLLEVDEIVQAFLQLLTKFPALLQKQWIFTVSPVRYSKDGLVENNRSKAVLLQAVHNMIQRYPEMYYFPAYEILIDELRDYRFYDSDLVHPSAQAIQYIYDRFRETVFDSETKLILHEVEDLVTASEHRHLHPGTEAHLKFMDAYLKKTEALAKKYPFLDLKEEMQHFII